MLPIFLGTTFSPRPQMYRTMTRCYSNGDIVFSILVGGFNRLWQQSQKNAEHVWGPPAQIWIPQNVRVPNRFGIPQSL